MITVIFFLKLLRLSSHHRMYLVAILIGQGVVPIFIWICAFADTLEEISRIPAYHTASTRYILIICLHVSSTKKIDTFDFEPISFKSDIGSLALSGKVMTTLNFIVINTNRDMLLIMWQNPYSFELKKKNRFWLWHQNVSHLLQHKYCYWCCMWPWIILTIQGRR